MSSWYVLAAYGLYDVAPTSRQWLIIPPLHEHMSLTFEDGAVFTTRREGSGPVAQVLWNGKPLNRSWLAHSEVTGGGELVFQLGEISRWGVDPADRPGLPLESAVVLAAPWAEASGDRFRGRQQVTLHAQETGAQIYWTLDAEGDPLAGTLYTEPLTLDRTCDLRFVAVSGPRTSPVVTALQRSLMTGSWRSHRSPTPSTPPGARRPDRRTTRHRQRLDAEHFLDGQPPVYGRWARCLDRRTTRGTDNWRTGGWHGYEGQDFSCVLDLGDCRCAQSRRSGPAFCRTCARGS